MSIDTKKNNYSKHPRIDFFDYSQRSLVFVLFDSLSYDVFVSTAQMLLNAIYDLEQNVCLESFCLFVFDECHHCSRKHPFQRIMNKYVDTRLDRNGDRRQLPQVKHRPEKSVLLFCVSSRTITTFQVFPMELFVFAFARKASDFASASKNQ